MVQRLFLGALLAALALGGCDRSPTPTTPSQRRPAVSQGSFTAAQRETLAQIARQTWAFFATALDPKTQLPLDNLSLEGTASRRGNYTSPTNIGVYFWAIVAAQDLGIVSHDAALQRATATLTTIKHLSTWHGLLFSWYDTTTGHRISGPGGLDQEGQPVRGAFLSTVDNAWFATGLILLRQVYPELAARATTLLNAMDLSVFYDHGNQSASETAGQLYGGYQADEGPASFHYGLLNSETRIAAYIGVGTHQMPGDVWWRTWRTMPAHDTWQAQMPQGSLVPITDPQSGKSFSVFEGHYRYGDFQFVPSWGGSMFEALMPNLVIPETSWGPKSFGRNDLLYTRAQIAYAEQQLHFPVWGLSPSSTPDDSGRYNAYGAHALATNAKTAPYDETTVTPYASFLALMVAPQEAFTNIQKLRSLTGLYGPYGFFDAVNPITGQIGHRYLVLDQAMILAALDNVLQGQALQQHVAHDPVIAATHAYLGSETFSL